MTVVLKMVIFKMVFFKLMQHLLILNYRIRMTHFARAMLRRRVHLIEIVIEFPYLSCPFTLLSRPSSSLTHTIVIVPALVALWSVIHTAASGIFLKYICLKVFLTSAFYTNPRLLTLISESYSISCSGTCWFIQE